MTLNATSLDWAIDFVVNHSDGDLFPKVLEIEAVQALRSDFIRLIESTTAGVSRGIPIGPHGAHLIAEATLIPIDNSMVSVGLTFLRYADDILVFCNSDKAAKQALARIAFILDKQQRLTLQRHKIKFFKPGEFQNLCDQMIEDRPISQDEDKLLKLIREYSGDAPYKTVSYNEISPDDWKNITNEIISGIIREYIDKPEVDYIRLRWFYRRLSQIGHPGAIDVSLEELVVDHSDFDSWSFPWYP